MLKKIAILASYWLIQTNLALAQGRGIFGTPDEEELPNPLQVTDITELLNQISYYLVVLVGPPIVTIFILYGAFQILTAGASGKPEQLQQGKKTILYAIVGYIILLLAHGVTFIIKELLGFQN